MDLASGQQLQVLAAAGGVFDGDFQVFIGEEAFLLGHIYAHEGQIGLGLVPGHESHLSSWLIG